MRSLPAMSAAPVLYSQSAYESPVRGAADDLLLLAGDGLSATDVVVYQCATDPTVPLAPPSSVPITSDAVTGVATVVSTGSVPSALTIRLPSAISENHVYVLWVQNTSGEWSNAVRINDPRPLWFSPAYVDATGSAAHLPRKLKVIGRNLQPGTAATR